MQQHTIALIGGTGKAGKYLLDELLKKDLSVKLLLRHPESFHNTNPLLKIVTGDARDQEAVKELMDGCHSIISAVGQSKGEDSVFSQATNNILSALQHYGIQRYIGLTGLNVDTPFDHKNEKVAQATEWMKTHYPKTTLDKQVEYQTLSESSIQWTLVRLPWILQTTARGKVAVSLTDCPGDQISATDLAHFLIDQLNSDTYLRQAPFIASLQLPDNGL